MVDFISIYFTDEKFGNKMLIIIGLICVIPTMITLLYVTKNKFLLGLYIVLISIGSIQILSGRTVFARCDEQMEILLLQAAGSPEQFCEEETYRMSSVRMSLKMLKIFEIGLILTGLMLIMFKRRTRLIYGLGVGLIIQGIASFIVDHLASGRADIYMTELSRFCSM